VLVSTTGLGWTWLLGSTSGLALLGTWAGWRSAGVFWAFGLGSCVVWAGLDFWVRTGWSSGLLWAGLPVSDGLWYWDGIFWVQGWTSGQIFCSAILIWDSCQGLWTEFLGCAGRLG
jgi:hypothetical protein